MKDAWDVIERRVRTRATSAVLVIIVIRGEVEGCGEDRVNYDSREEVFVCGLMRETDVFDTLDASQHQFVHLRRKHPANNCRAFRLLPTRCFQKSLH